MRLWLGTVIAEPLLDHCLGAASTVIKLFYITTEQNKGCYFPRY